MIIFIPKIGSPSRGSSDDNFNRQVGTARVVATTHDAIDRFAPVFDGIAIPHQTWTPHAPAEAHDIPLLIGNTTHESAAFIGTALETPIATDDALVAKIVAFGGRRASDPARVDLFVVETKFHIDGTQKS